MIFFKKKDSKIVLAFCVLFFVVPLFNNLVAQVTNQEKEEELESDLPEVIKAKVVDITHIELNPRERFQDTVEPKIGQARGIYPKERLWNLPNIFTPSKVNLKEIVETDNYLISLEARPRLPSSLLYNVLFAGDIQPVRGLINIDSQNLGDDFTEGRGEYNWNSFRVSLGYSPKLFDLDIDGDVKYETKELGWLKYENSEIPNESIRKKLTLFKSDFDWSQQVTDETEIKLDLNGDFVEVSEDRWSGYDKGVNLNLSFDVNTYWPFINPFSFGGSVEYSSTDSESPPRIGKAELPTYRVYARNHYTALGPFVLDLSGEFVNLNEPNEDSETETKLFFNPGLILTTKLSERTVLQNSINRSVEKETLSELYFHQDYIAFNPFLRTPKSWNALISLKYQTVLENIEFKISGFGKKVDDYIVLRYHSLSFTPEGFGTITKIRPIWYPDNIEDVLLYGGEFSFGLNTDKLDIWAKYKHEIQESDEVEQVPYRPNDYFEFSLAYSAEYGINIELGGEFGSTRFTDVEQDEKLESYFIGKTKIGKTLGKYAIIFLEMQFGEYEPIRDYKFSDYLVDFGVKLTM